MKWNFASGNDKKHIKNGLCTNKTKKNEKNTINAKNIVESSTNGTEILTTNDKEQTQEAL